MFIQTYYTDIGIKRKSNQDSLALIKADTDYGEVLLAAVCDGMGGHSMGELASKHCITALCGWFKKRFPYLLYQYHGDLEECFRTELYKLVQQTNLELVAYGNDKGIEMGSTLTAIIFARGKYYCLHVGDSRAYLIDNTITQITEDQSLLAEEVRTGVLTADEAKKDKRKNLLLESVGITSEVTPLFYSGNVKSDATYLLCSDGFWHYLENRDLQRYLDAKTIKDNRMLRMHLHYLVDVVMQRGEKDNITAVGIIPRYE